MTIGRVLYVWPSNACWVWTLPSRRLSATSAKGPLSGAHNRERGVLRTTHSSAGEVTTSKDERTTGHWRQVYDVGPFGDSQVLAIFESAAAVIHMG